MIDLGTLDNIRKYVTYLIEKEERIDGRKLNEYRRIKIIPNYVKNAEGSCYVALGDTKVVAGVKLDLGTPFPDTPDEGIFVVSLEYSPLSFPTVEPGPPSPKEIEDARVIDRAIRESHFIKTKELVIEPGKTVWTIFIDLYVLNDDGNIVDAGMLAAVGSLLTARFPKLIRTEEGYKLDRKEKEGHLPLNKNKIPLLFTFAKIGNKIIVDPNKYEEEAADSLLHVGITNNINALQKRGDGTLTLDEIDEILNRSFDLYPKVKKILLKSIE